MGARLGVRRRAGRRDHGAQSGRDLHGRERPQDAEVHGGGDGLYVRPGVRAAHGVVKAAMRNGAIIVDAGGRPAITFTDPGRFSAIAYVGGDNLIERVASRVPDPVLGEVTVVTTYSDYRDFGGVRFPTRIQQSAAGYPVLDVTVKDVQRNASADITAPDSVRSAAERVAVEKVADGVW